MTDQCRVVCMEYFWYLQRVLQVRRDATGLEVRVGGWTEEHWWTDWSPADCPLIWCSASEFRTYCNMWSVVLSIHPPARSQVTTRPSSNPLTLIRFSWTFRESQYPGYFLQVSSHSVHSVHLKVSPLPWDSLSAATSHIWQYCVLLLSGEGLSPSTRLISTF